MIWNLISVVVYMIWKRVGPLDFNLQILQTMLSLRFIIIIIIIIGAKD